MKTKIALLALIGIALSSLTLLGQDSRAESREELLKLAKGLKYQQGEISLKGGLAKLEVPKDFNYLDPDDTETVLVKMWGNPPRGKMLGMLMPADKNPLKPDCWVVVLSYTEDGYVKDDDAGKINYDDLLKSMKKAVAESSAERQKKGYPGLELVGWAEPPRYDAAAHKLYWAKEIKFTGEKEDTLNYDIRILGRRGVLVLSAVASMPQLSEIESHTPQILSMVNFNEGNRYADFNPKGDKVATYGIAALVAGGIAAKLGLFKMLWVFLLAAKKFVVIGIVGISAWFKKRFGKAKVTPTPSV
ncbi:MAG TPA: DUF2167 domain-containing protein [Verrucomicrobiae bacterium]|jgi:uncharacterized membrane-anchored protein